MTGRCPRCGHEAIQTSGGMLLDPEPCLWGVWLATGAKVTARDVIHRRPQHAMHTCPPQGQIDLFEEIS